jgi:copper chaperone CopZ/outer membrane murein-binding lipoprotein Lpp
MAEVRLVGGGLLVGVLALSGCASTQSGDRAAMDANAVVHVVSQADEAATHSKEPISGDKATLWVNGLGCPQCASNIDFQLKRVRGVSDVFTDLSNGKVTVSLAGGRPPSPHLLSEAVKDAGMTLVKIE